MPYAQRETATGPKKMLAIDGGGLRGVMSLQILARMEQMLQDVQKRPSLVLADEFDYIAGTSTGAIIAAGLALGKTVKELDGLYQSLGPALFKKRSLPMKAWSLYSDGALKRELQTIFGERTFGDDDLKSLLLCVLQNSSTDSPWPLSNCTKAKYNDPERDDCNLNIPLWQVVRASTAAPIFFPPEEVTLGPRTFVFQDGGVTTYNNPAYIQYVMATEPEYGLCWPAGDDNLLSVSIGTGLSAAARPGLTRGRVNVVHNATHLIGYLMNSASVEQDRLCRFIGTCRHGDEIDREVKAILGHARPQPPRHPGRFSYVRYNADISQDGLSKMGLGHIDSAKVRKLDAVDGMNDLRTIGQHAAQQVDINHFSGFLGGST
jgi:uncharacterized protein